MKKIFALINATDLLNLLKKCDWKQSYYQREMIKKAFLVIKRCTTEETLKIAKDKQEGKVKADRNKIRIQFAIFQ